MKLKTKLMALAVASAMVGSAAAIAAPLPISLITPDSTLTDWQGMDWNSLGTAVISGFVPVTDDVFTTTFWGTATALYDGGATITPPNLSQGFGDTGTYEYTIFASLTEKNFSCAGGVSCTFFALGGSFSVYFDDSPDANYKTGAGITDGTLLFSGLIGPQLAGSFLATSATNGFGAANLVTSITYTNPLFIDPDLASGFTGGFLNIGSNVTNGWVNSGSMPGANGISVALPQDAIVLQADMNSDIKSVPEPASLALLGLGLFGLGAMRRKS